MASVIKLKHSRVLIVCVGVFLLILFGYIQDWGSGSLNSKHKKMAPYLSDKLANIDIDLLAQSLSETGVKSPVIDRLQSVKVKQSGQSEPQSRDGNSAAVKSSELASLNNRNSGNTALLIIACNRPEIERALNAVYKHKPKDRIPVIVSQDCNHEPTSEVIDKFSDRLIHLKYPVREPPQVRPGDERWLGYYKLARHYKWALEQTFNVLMYDNVIILEDDIEVAPGFFKYFEAFTPLLRADPSLMCISGWNDNGKAELVGDANQFHRSDFFSGLGWMLTRKFWEEIHPKWPLVFWDDWLRQSFIRNGRSCIRPEITLSRNFGDNGVSKGQFHEQHIATIKMNEEELNFESRDGVDITRFEKSRYDAVFKLQLTKLSRVATSAEIKAMLNSDDPENHPLYLNNPNVVTASDADVDDQFNLNRPNFCGRQCLRRYVIYYDWLDQDQEFHGYRNFVPLAKEWNLMDDIREGTARVAYQRTVCFKSHFKNKLPLKVYMNGKQRIAKNQFEQYIAICISPKPKDV
ncbi:hypothetical protein MP228_003789 [Amoeboaphelidium protococcarum]|nr:hypothetical protein MP228_003789 [Amoeboaphelidium protococcarum]